jgi:hypothetical protein
LNFFFQISSKVFREFSLEIYKIHYILLYKSSQNTFKLEINVRIDSHFF